MQIEPTMSTAVHAPELLLVRRWTTVAPSHGAGGSGSSQALRKRGGGSPGWTPRLCGSAVLLGPKVDVHTVCRGPTQEAPGCLDQRQTVDLSFEILRCN